ncbi:MAG: AAA family ATPase [Calditrichia bacterium]
MDKKIFNPEIGHPDIQTNILHSIQNNRLPHAYLFYGKEGTGKDAFALELARLLNCDQGPLYLCGKCPACVKIARLQHPDVKFIFPTPSPINVKPEEIAAAQAELAANPYRRIKFPGKNTFISIDTIRELKTEAKFKLYEGKKKIFIISQAEEMRPEAANALLKILEEPPQNLMLILTSSQFHRLLPTIRSRCQLIHFPPFPGDFILKLVHKYVPDPPEKLASIVRLAQGNIKLAFDFIEDDVMEKREQAVELLRKVVKIDLFQKLMKDLNKITATRDRGEMQLLLFFLLTWFRDAYHYHARPEQVDHLTNVDLQSTLQKFVDAYPRADYERIIREVEKAYAELEDPRNLNPLLIFINLSIKLNQLITLQ